MKELDRLVTLLDHRLQETAALETSPPDPMQNREQYTYLPYKTITT